MALNLGAFRKQIGLVISGKSLAVAAILEFDEFKEHETKGN